MTRTDRIERVVMVCVLFAAYFLTKIAVRAVAYIAIGMACALRRTSATFRETKSFVKYVADEPKASRGIVFKCRGKLMRMTHDGIEILEDRKKGKGLKGD